jgi:mono/diheme cytochrome c family protein
MIRSAFSRDLAREKLRRCPINPSTSARSSLLGFCALFAFGLVLSGCRQDMHNQPKFIPLRSSEFFPDRRSARYPVAGTVPQLCPVAEGAARCIDPDVDAAQLDPASYFLTGRHNGTTLGNELPEEVLAKAQGQSSSEKLHAVLARGQQRYNIYCTPCHSLAGDGNGMIVQRGYKRPPSFHEDRLRNAPLGHLYDIISNGFGAMPDYASQIHPEDRWAIAAYIRALQLSQGAKDADLTAEERTNLQVSPPIQIPPTSKNTESAPALPPPGGAIR